MVVAILFLTIMLIGGSERHRETVEAFTPYQPLITGVVLIGMGLFIPGVSVGRPEQIAH